MKTITKTTTYATFQELSTEQQKRVLYKYSDYLVHENWYYPTQEHINMILSNLFNDKSDNIYFDTDRNSFCSFKIEVSLRDLLDLLESNKIQDIYSDLAEYLLSEIQSIKDCYFYKRKRLFDIISDSLYNSYIETYHVKNGIEVKTGLSVFGEYKNINSNCDNLSDCIEKFFVSLSEYFQKLFSGELEYLYSDVALIEYFGDYDTHFDIETLEME